MREVWKRILMRTPFYSLQIMLIAELRKRKEVWDWKRSGRKGPPPHIVKQGTLESYAKRYALKTFVETGTYYGDMVKAMENKFDRIYSIEISRELYEKSRKRFEGLKHIILIHGDSGQELANVVRSLDHPTLFWLDGHYSAGVTAKGDKDTPVYEELGHIFDSPVPGHVIIIDDARCFGRQPDYPSIQDITDYVLERNPRASIEVQDDSIRIVTSH